MSASGGWKLSSKRGGGGLSVVMVCRMAMVAAFMEDILCGVRMVRVVALRRGVALGRREATWSCNCWVGRCRRGCCFEVLDYGGLRRCLCCP